MTNFGTSSIDLNDNESFLHLNHTWSGLLFLSGPDCYTIPSRGSFGARFHRVRREKDTFRQGRPLRKDGQGTDRVYVHALDVNPDAEAGGEDFRPGRACTEGAGHSR